MKSKKFDMKSLDYKKAVITCLTEKYFTFTGRASFSEIFPFLLFELLFVEIGLSIVELIFKWVSDGSNIFLFILINLAYAYFFIPSVAVTTRRLHDTDHSGWWQILPVLSILIYYPLVFFLGSVISIYISATLCIVSFIIFLIFLLQKRTEGKNRFGPPPVGYVLESGKKE